MINIYKIISVYQKLGFVIFDDKLNILGIRTQKGEWNDSILFFYKENNEWVIKQYIGTTEPSVSYISKLLNPRKNNKNGIAVLQSNSQYLNCFIKGKHKNKYTALVQNWKFNFPTLRKTHDGTDYYNDTIYNDVQGLNLHSTQLGYFGKYISNFSEGCQVIKDWTRYNSEVIPLINRFSEKQIFFSYTLIDEAYFR